MAFQLPFADLLQKIKQKIGSDVKVYLVGGAVRDALLERSVKDLDFLVEGDSQAAAKKVSKALSGVNFVIDDKRQTSRVLFPYRKNENLILDFNKLLARNILEDLRNRDFTINAIAIDLDYPGLFIDPLHGEHDLANKKLVLCSSVSLENDPVRILRVIRFTCDLGSAPSKSLSNAIQKALPKLITTSAERRRDEIFRILSLPNAAKGVGLLNELSVIWALLPELERLKKIPLDSSSGGNYWDQIMRILDFADSWHRSLFATKSTTKSNDIFFNLAEFDNEIKDHLATPVQPERDRISLLRFAILVHAIGIPQSTFREWDGTTCHFGTAKESASQVPDIVDRFALSNAEKDYLCTFLLNQDRLLHFSHFSGEILERSLYRFFKETGMLGIDICIFNYLQTLVQDSENKEELQTILRSAFSAYWHRKIANLPPIIKGEEIKHLLHIPPGALVGRAIHALGEEQAVGRVTSKEDAEKFLSSWYSKNIQGK